MKRRQKSTPQIHYFRSPNMFIIKVKTVLRIPGSHKVIIQQTEIITVGYIQVIIYSSLF